MTDVALKEYLEGLISAAEKQTKTRWEAHGREHVLLKEAVDSAREALEIRLEALNAFRTQITAERHEFLKKNEYDIHHDVLEKRVSKIENDKSNLDGRFWMLGSALTGLTILLPLLFHYLVR